jgi:hypothetical protein
MGSKMVGFRVADNIGGEIERAAGERGQTTAEFLRKLVDNELYPGKNEKGANMSQPDPEALQSLGEWVDGLSQDIVKLHVCPDCEHSLHVHRLEGSWHLECLVCGFYTVNYKYPKWKEPGVKLPTYMGGPKD